MDFGVLGSFSVTAEGRPLALGGPVQRRLLAALVARAPLPVSPDMLIDDVWGESPPSTAVRTLHSHVARLRDALGRGTAHAIETVDGRYRLPLRRDDLDAWVFEDLVHVATSNGHTPDQTARILRQGLALWRGPAYGDFIGTSFADAESRRLESLRDSALEAVIEAELADGRGPELVPELEALVVEHPYRERLWSALVVALYRSGRQADALEAFQRARAVLGDELGVDPGPELRAVEAKVLAHDPSLLARVPQHVHPCPWKGLSAYEPADADYFVGRDGLVSETIARLVDYSVVIVTGPSGSGKSSLLRAGVIPALAAGAIIGSATWRVELVAPGNEPLSALRAALAQSPDLLVLDPGDDLLISDSPPAYAALSDELRPFLSRGMRLVMSLRGDLFGRLTELKSLAPRAAAGTVLVGVPHDDELRQVVELPARRVGLDVEPALVEAVVADVGGRPASLPLLSTALVRTWERREGTVLTLAGYRSAGGTSSALERLAEEAYEGLDEDERLAVRRILLRLVINVDGVWRRRRVPLDEVAPPSDLSATQALAAFTAHRLLSVDVGDAQLSHEALTVAWPRFAGWLADRELSASVVDHLSTAAHAWLAGGRDDADVYRGTRLQAAIDLEAAQPAELGPVEHEFIQCSREAADRELARLRQGRRRLSYVAFGLVVLLVVASLAFAFAVRSGNEAARAAREADAQRVGLQALTRTDFSQKLLLAVAAVSLHSNAGTQASLLTALQDAGGASTTVPLASVARSLTVSNDGWIGVAEADGAVETFDPALGSGRVVRPQAFWTSGTPTAGLHWLDGHAAMVIGADDPARIFSLNPLSGAVSAIADDWSSTVFGTTGDARWLVAADASRVESTDLLARSVEGTDPDARITLAQRPMSIVTGPGSTVTVIERGAVEVVDVASGRRLSTVTVPSPTLAVASADATTAAVLTGEDEIEVIDLRTGRRSRPIPPSGEPLTTLALSGDGSLLAGAAPRDGVIRVWSTVTGLELATFTPALGNVAALVWAPGDRLLAAPTSIPALQAWDLARYASPSIPVLAAGPAGVGGALVTAVDPSSRTLGVGTDRGHVWFLDLDSGRTRASSGPEGEAVVSVAFSDRGRVALTADAVGTLTVWDVATATPVETLTSPASVDARTESARAPVGPDGRTAASFIDGYGLRLVDVPSRRVGAPVYPDVGLQPQFEVRGWSPDGRHVVIAAQGVTLSPSSGQSPAVWALVDPRDGAVLWSTEAPEQTIAGDVVFGDEGKTIVVPGESGKLYFLDAVTGARLDPVDGATVRPVAVNERQTPASVSLSPNGRQLSVVSAAHPAEIWDVASGQQRGTIDVPVATFSAHFLSDHELVSVTSGGAVTMHNLTASDWISLACRAAGREITPLEWEQFLPAHDYRAVCAGGRPRTEAT